MDGELEEIVEFFGGEGPMTMAYAIYKFEELVRKGLLEGPTALTAVAKAMLARAEVLGWTADPDRYARDVKYLAAYGLEALRGNQ